MLVKGTKLPKEKVYSDISEEKDTNKIKYTWGTFIFKTIN